MKQGIVVFFLLMFLFSCDEQVGYEVSGEAVNADSESLFLKHLEIGKSTIIDTAIMTDGQFEFRGVIEKPGIYQINAEKKQGVLVYLNPNSKLNLNLNFDELDAYTVKGNEESEELREFRAFLLERSLQNKEIVDRYAQAEDGEQRLAIQNESQEFAKETQELIREKISNTTSAYVGIGHLMMSGLRGDQNRELFNQFGDRVQVEIPNSSYAKDFQDVVNKLNASKPALTIGDTAPEISLQTPSGKQMNLSDVRGKYVLLDFWAAWCGPCRRENPNVVNAYNKYKDKGFVVFNVSLDRDKNKWVRAIEQDKLDWPYHVSDLKSWNSVAAQEYGIRSIPASYLLDPEGKIIATNLRGPALENKLKELLG